MMEINETIDLVVIIDYMVKNKFIEFDVIEELPFLICKLWRKYRSKLFYEKAFVSEA